MHGFPSTICWNGYYFPPLNCLDIVVKSIQRSIMWGLFLDSKFHSLIHTHTHTHTYIHLSLCHYHKVLINNSFLVHFEIKKCEASNFVFFFKIVLVLLGSLHFHMNFKISLSLFMKKLAGILTDCIESMMLNLWC